MLTNPDTMADESSAHTPSCTTHPATDAVNILSSVAISETPANEARILPPAVAQQHDQQRSRTTVIEVDPSPCHFMKLPAELRLMVYKLVFLDILSDISKLVDTWFHADEEILEAATRLHGQRLLALPQTSRTFHVERFDVCKELVATLLSDLTEKKDAPCPRYDVTGKIDIEDLQAICDLCTQCRVLTKIEYMLA